MKKALTLEKLVRSLNDDVNLKIKGKATYEGTAKAFKNRFDNDVKSFGISILGKQKVKDFLGNTIYLK